ncbi:MAG TPA: ABC transporter permease [Humisphaera sp.]
MLLSTPILLFNLLWQSAFLALGQIWANKLRAMLTTVGIVIGVASVTAVIAALTGLKQNVLAEFETFGTNKIFIIPRPPEGQDRAIRVADLRFEPDLFEGLLDHCPSVKAVTRQTGSTKTVSFGSKSESNVDVQGIDPSWHDIENRRVTTGRTFSLTDNLNARPVCLINAALQEKLGLPPDPTDASILIGDRRYRVVGVVESRTESSMFRQNSSGAEAFVPFSTAYRRGSYISVVAASRSPDVSEEARAEIIFFLRKRRKIEPGRPDNFRVEAVEKFVQQFNTIATGMTAVAGGIVGISLLVGGVGIMNIMLVSVSERTREIGLRKAVGARPAVILLQFLVEAVVLCLMGGLVGLICGQGLTTLMTMIPGAQLSRAAIPWWAVALSFGFSAMVGVVFGLFPAIKAARLDPIEALRHE